MLRKIVITLMLSSLTGCITSPEQPNPYPAQLDQISSQIINAEKSLAGQIAKSCRQDYQKLAAVVAQNSKAETNSLLSSQEASGQCEKIAEANSKSEKLVLGEVETIYLVKEKMSIDARVDTGAETSSLGVYKLARFERDGKKWVKFALSNDEKAPVFRYPIYDIVRIKQESDEKAEKRREIKIDIKVGSKKYRKQIFNLADRSHLEYQALIGRNFLRDIAMVDVSSSHLLDKE